MDIAESAFSVHPEDCAFASSCHDEFLNLFRQGLLQNCWGIKFMAGLTFFYP